MGELGARLDLSSGGVTRLIDRLVDAGYVDRATSPTDRRVHIATLTTAGGRVLEDAARIHSENTRVAIADKLSQAELSTFLLTLQRLRLNGQRAR